MFNNMFRKQMFGFGIEIDKPCFSNGGIYVVKLEDYSCKETICLEFYPWQLDTVNEIKAEFMLDSEKCYNYWKEKSERHRLKEEAIKRDITETVQLVDNSGNKIVSLEFLSDELYSAKNEEALKLAARKCYDYFKNKKEEN